MDLTAHKVEAVVFPVILGIRQETLPDQVHGEDCRKNCKGTGKEYIAGPMSSVTLIMTELQAEKRERDRLVADRYLDRFQDKDSVWLAELDLPGRGKTDTMEAGP